MSVHIRKAARKTPWGLHGVRYYNYCRGMESGEIRDPQGETLCGAEATTDDTSWADTRWAKHLAYVDCAECVAVRETAKKPGVIA